MAHSSLVHPSYSGKARMRKPIESISGARRLGRGLAWAQTRYPARCIDPELHRREGLKWFKCRREIESTLYVTLPFSNLAQLITCVALGTVLWSISKPTLDPGIIRGKLAAVRDSAFFPFCLPTGVNMQDMEKVWQELQFNPAAPVDVPFKTEMFRPAPRSVRVLRKLSRKGQSYLDSNAREQGVQEKFVLGLPNDAREMAPLLASAHGNIDTGPLSVPSTDEHSSSPVGTTTTSSLPTHFEGEKEPITSPVMARTTDQEQELTAAPPLMTSQVVGTATVDVGEQAGQPFGTVPGTKARSGDFVSKFTVSHLEEMLSKDQRRIVEHDAGGPLIAVHPKPAFSGSGTAERNSKSSQLIRNLKRSLVQDTDEID